MDNSETPQIKSIPQDQKKGIVRLIAAVVVGLLFFSFVSPTAIPLVMLVVGFVMLGLVLYGALKLCLILLGIQPRLRPIQRRAILLLGVCLPLLLIMMQSLGQLTIRDTLTLGGLFVVSVFYVLRFGRAGNKG